MLVAEDDAVLALDMEEILREAGVAKVVVHPTIAAIMAELETGSPDVLVLDVHLADRDDGWALAELVDVLRAKPPRIVFSTGSPDDIPAAIAEMGVVLEKPYPPEKLVEAVAGERVGLLGRFIRG